MHFHNWYRSKTHGACDTKSRDQVGKTNALGDNRLPIRSGEKKVGQNLGRRSQIIVALRSSDKYLLLFYSCYQSGVDR